MLHHPGCVESRPSWHVVQLDTLTPLSKAGSNGELVPDESLQQILRPQGLHVPRASPRGLKDAVRAAEARRNRQPIGNFPSSAAGAIELVCRRDQREEYVRARGRAASGAARYRGHRPHRTRAQWLQPRLRFGRNPAPFHRRRSRRGGGGCCAAPRRRPRTDNTTGARCRAPQKGTMMHRSIRIAGRLAVALALACLSPVATLADSWTLVSPMNGPRAFHSANFLPDGRILVAGGRTEISIILNTAEIYDPATNSWTVADPMASIRMSHVSVTLEDGRILITGGNVGSGAATAGVEIFDPTTETWSAAASMSGARYNHIATRLADGRVLVAGGYGSNFLSSAEIYDPVADTWSAASNMAEARSNFSGTLLPDGKCSSPEEIPRSSRPAARSTIRQPIHGAVAGRSRPPGRTTRRQSWTINGCSSLAVAIASADSRRWTSTTRPPGTGPPPHR